MGSWNYDACCAVSGNDCKTYSGYCYDMNSSSDFIFGLSPGAPQRFGPKPGGAGVYQNVKAREWPAWGYGDADLTMGYGGGALGANGYCDQGTPNEVCGGNRNWGPAQSEVWY
jgi:hypothetical protein